MYIEPVCKGEIVKIDKSSTPLPVSSAIDGKARTTAKSGDSSPALGSSGTSVSLGATSAKLRTMESGMADTPVVNAAKVAEIKQAISEGRFQVNAGAVADSLIKSVNDLLAARKA